MSGMRQSDLIPAREAIKLFPGKRPGKCIDKETFRRYCTKGCKLPDGSIIRLWSVRRGGVRYTTSAKVEEFQALQLLGGLER